MQAAVTAVFREGGSHTIFREVKYKFIFVGKTCPGGIFKPGVPVRFRVIFAPQILVNVPLCFVEHLHEGEGCTRRQFVCQHGHVFGDPLHDLGFGCAAARFVLPADGIKENEQVRF